MRRPPSSPLSSIRRWLVLALAVVLLASVATATFPLLGDSAVDGSTADRTDARTARADDPFAGELALSDANATFRGGSANDTFGRAVASVGDLNDDGVDDVAVGAPLNDTGGSNAGAVYVFYGPVEPGEFDASNASVTIYGDARFTRVGASLASADVNGDGTTDLVIGAPGDDTAASNAGAAYVFYGGDGVPANASVADADHALLGEAAFDRAGRAVAGVGNHTDDQQDRVLVGAPGNDAAATAAGAAYVVRDPATGTTSLANATARLVGERAGDYAGWSVSSGGDFDGDGDADVLVGAPRANTTAPDSGAAYVFTEPPSGNVSLADADVRLAGAKRGDRAGWAVASAGDVNDDGYGDVAVGAPLNDTNGNRAGVAYVVEGASDVRGTVDLNASALVLYGEAAGDRAGWSVAAAGSGDVTCDRYADVLVGAPWNDSAASDAGAAYLVTGSADPDGERGLATAQATFRGVAAGDRAGWAVSDAGVATPDDSEDVLVGAPYADTPDTNAGAAYLLDGDCDPPTERPPNTTTTSTTKQTTTKPTTTKPTTTEPTTTKPTTEKPTEEPSKDVRVVFNGCGNAVVHASGLQYPVTVTVQVFNPGNGPNAGYRVVEQRLVASGDSVASPGGKMVAIYVEGAGGFENPTFEETGASARCPGGQKPGDPIDDFPPYDDESDDDEPGEEDDDDDSDDDESGEEDDGDDDDDDD